MNKFLKTTSILLLMISFFILLYIKNRTVALKNELGKIMAEIEFEEENISLLQAELSYLKNPARLYKIAVEQMNFRPLKPEDICQKP